MVKVNTAFSISNPGKVGLVFGAILGGWHIFWALLVFMGTAQAIYDFILWAHMIHLAIRIGPFDAKAALILVVVTSALGYIFGYMGAWVWNRVHR